MIFLLMPTLHEIQLVKIGMGDYDRPKYAIKFTGKLTDIRFDSAYPESEIRDLGRAPIIEYQRNRAGLIWGQISQPLDDAMSPDNSRKFIIWNGGTWSTGNAITFVHGATCVITPYQSDPYCGFSEAHFFDRGRIISLGKCHEITARTGDVFNGEYYVYSKADGVEKPFTFQLSLGVDDPTIITIDRVIFRWKKGRQTEIKRIRVKGKTSSTVGS